MKDKFHFLCHPPRALLDKNVFNNKWFRIKDRVKCSSERCLVRFRTSRKLNKKTTLKKRGVNKPNITSQQEVVLMSDDEQGVIDPVVRWE